MAETPAPQQDGDAGDSSAELLERLYDELRKLARGRMARLRPGNTLQPTALVHEVFLRLSKDGNLRWNGEAHFFGAAAMAMRRILVEQARRKQRIRHGGDQERVDLDEVDLPVEMPIEDLLGLDQALTKLEATQPRQAQIVMLRWFAGLEREEVAKLLDTSLRTVDREWRTAAARLQKMLQEPA
jgi:RNA polymerase sigma factor (TIGR02999 family)